jgi:hypothetical protein
MSTIQIVGIAAAAVVVLLLIIALIVTRKSGEEKPDADAASGGGASFLDSSPSDTFAKLGRPEQVSPPPVERAPVEAAPLEAPPVETPTTMPAGPAVVMTATGVASVADGGLGLDWDQPQPPKRWDAPPAVTPAPAPSSGLGPAAVTPEPAAHEPEPEIAEPEPLVDESEVTGELPVVAPEADGNEPADEVSAGATGELPVITPVVSEPAADAVSEAASEADAEDGAGWVADVVAGSEATPGAEVGPEASDDLVPLSSIIVTTSTKMVDLRDPDVRRMLTELVTFEIDQATQFRQQGQSVDAVLQLTEAEKICRALGKHDTAREIRDMMRDLKD